MYFCVFCDTILMTSEELKQHLIIHLISCDKNEWQKTITKSENDFIESLLRYESQINHCFQLKPKQLPANNVENLLIGCPVCNQIINCFELIKTRNEDQIQCFCGQISDELDVFQCIDCKLKFHCVCVDRNHYSGLYFC
jgi:hypothetical protein